MDWSTCQLETLVMDRCSMTTYIVCWLQEAILSLSLLKELQWSHKKIRVHETLPPITDFVMQLLTEHRLDYIHNGGFDDNMNTNQVVAHLLAARSRNQTIATTEAATVVKYDPETGGLAHLEISYHGALNRYRKE
ncbi:unknown protein [Seminavis robusta]|uniref:Uncharacterized protein n=1 Tax=Seminavis robusta TaxID=568900 RepID=A0A9N8EQP6_9STRA|nr:unknown protein [Seminavis robusta]|eukprot:Sro1690_g291350.1 n/a (135) ;mRNA; f:9137-9541